MEQMNFTLEGLNEIIATAERLKQNTTESKMNKFAPIVAGVARKYASKWVDREDLEQDLWLRVMELIQDCGGVENVDESLVARVCYNKAVDKYRYDRRRYEANCQFIEGSSVDDETLGKDPDYFEAQRCDKFMRGYDLVLIKEVINLFEIGSRERQYAVMKLVNKGVLEIHQLDPWDRAIAVILEDDDNETGYIYSMGYKSHCPGSWTCKKRDMKTLVHKFLDC